MSGDGSQISQAGASPNPVNLTPEQDQRLIASGYEPLACVGKRPVADRWQASPITAETLAADRAAHPDATSTGIRTGRVVGCDIDFLVPEITDEIEKIVREVLGAAPLRRHGAKGAMLIYQADTPSPKLAITAKGEKAKYLVAGKERWQKVELLGTGQQFIAYGVHPDTHRPYEWRGDDPLQCPIIDLPQADPTQRTEIVHRVMAFLENRGYGPCFSTLDGTERKRAASGASGQPLSWGGLRQRLSYIHPAFTGERPACYPKPSPKRQAAPLDYTGDGWLKLGLCLRDGDVPLLDHDEHDWIELAEQWSCGLLWYERTGEALDLTGRYPEQGVEKRLAGHKKAAGAKATVATLISYALDAGCPLAPADAADPNEVFAAALGNTETADKAEAKDDDDFPILEPWDFKDRPQPRWIVDGILREKSFFINFGKTESFKTFILLDLLASIAAGLPAFGRFTVFLPGDVVLCLDEDPDDVMTVRFPAWCKARGIANPFAKPFSGPGRFVIIPRVPLVSDENQVLRLMAQIDKHGVKPQVIALDTTAKAMGGLDQNDAKDAGMLMAAGSALRRRYGCSIWATHHPRKDDDEIMRGSDALIDDVDGVWRSTRIAKSGIGTQLENVKIKNAAKPSAPIYLLGQLFDLGIIDQSGARVSAPVFDAVGEKAWNAAKAGLKQSEAHKHELTAVEVRNTLRARGACPDGAARWRPEIGQGGLSTSMFALAILQARRQDDSDPAPITEGEIDTLKRALNRGAKDSGFLNGYVVSEAGGSRTWAIAPTHTTSGGVF